MHWIVYNGLRTVMIRATKTRPKVSLNAISFKACIQAVRQWSAAADPNITPAAQRRVLRELLESIATATIPDRPGRTEPRCVKRRPKNYQRMTKPRDQMRVTPHRGKRAKKAA